MTLVSALLLSSASSNDDTLLKPFVAISQGFAHLEESKDVLRGLCEHEDVARNALTLSVRSAAGVMHYLASVSDTQRDLASTETALKAASKLSRQFGVDADALQSRKYVTVSTTKLRRYQSTIEKFLGPAHREIVKSLIIHEPLDVCNLVAETFMQNVMMLIDIAENRKHDNLPLVEWSAKHMDLTFRFHFRFGKEDEAALLKEYAEFFAKTVGYDVDDDSLLEELQAIDNENIAGEARREL